MLTATQTANRLIKEHGDLAPNIADKRAQELRNVGDEIGNQQWMKVMIETKYLLARDNAE
jgi:hypothetical protein